MLTNACPVFWPADSMLRPKHLRFSQFDRPIFRICSTPRVLGIQDIQPRPTSTRFPASSKFPACPSERLKNRPVKELPDSIWNFHGVRSRNHYLIRIVTNVFPIDWKFLGLLFIWHRIRMRLSFEPQHDLLFAFRQSGKPHEKGITEVPLSVTSVSRTPH
jgi:hypothetical protein